MEDIPQPADEPYTPGDRVTVYLAPDDPDADHHGRDCRVVSVVEDDLGTETGRDLDSLSYRVEDAVTGAELPIVPRHRDLVPTNDK